MYRNPTLPILTACAMAVLMVFGAVNPAQADQEIGHQLKAVPSDPQHPLRVRAGQTFALELSGVWPHSCVPRMIGLEGTGHRRVLRLTGTAPEQACARVLTPFEHRLEDLRFEDREAGIIEIALIVDGEGWLDVQTLVVESNEEPAAVYSGFDVQGAWYSPAHSGSGLTLLHTRNSDTDTLVGMWMNFDGAGAPRWYLLANAVWVAPERVEGMVYQLNGEPFACTAQTPNPDCQFAAVRQRAARQEGLFSIKFENATQAVLEFSQRAGEGQPPVSARPIELQSMR